MKILRERRTCFLRIKTRTTRIHDHLPFFFQIHTILICNNQVFITIEIKLAQFSSKHAASKFPHVNTNVISNQQKVSQQSIF